MSWAEEREKLAHMSKAEQVYRVARKAGARLCARDLIPPAILVPPGDAALIEAAGGNIGRVIDSAREQSFNGRVQKWWNDWAGPFVRRLQVVMKARLWEHIERRENAMWADHRRTLKVEGEPDRDARTGKRLDGVEDEPVEVLN